MISYPADNLNQFPLRQIFLIELNDQEWNRRMNNGYLNGKSFKKPLSQNPWKKHYMCALIYRHKQKFLKWFSSRVCLKKNFGSHSGMGYESSSCLGAQLFTSLMADLHQDINCVSSFSGCLNGTFPWRNSSIKTLVH